MRALLSGLLMMTAVACASALDFDVSQAVPEQIVSGSPLPAVLSGLFAFPLQVDIQSQIAAHKTGPISEITLSGLVLDITATKQPAGDTDDWSFLTHADLFVASTKDGTTLAKVKVATVDAPGKVQQLIFVPVAGVNLLPYVNEGAQLTAETTGSLPPDDTSFAGTATFRIRPL
jgi:hypothetical protein